MSLGFSSIRNHWEGASSDRRLIYKALGISLLVHLIFFIFSWFKLFDLRPWEKQEWVIDAEVITDFDVSKAKESVIPKAKIAEEAAVHRQILPQLPKQYEVEAPSQPEADAMEKLEEKVIPNTPEPVKSEEEPIPIPKPPEVDANKIKMEDLAKRRALEQLRNDKKFADNLQAQKNDALTKLKNEQDNNAETDGLLSGVVTDRYQLLVKQAIEKHYQLPDIYNLKSTDLVVAIEISIDRSGNIIETDVIEPSGDQVFDDLIIGVLNKASPLPKPPIGLNPNFILRFTPGSLR